MVRLVVLLFTVSITISNSKGHGDTVNVLARDTIDLTYLPGGRILLFGGAGIPAGMYAGLQLEAGNFVIRGHLGKWFNNAITTGIDINVHFGHQRKNLVEKYPSGFYRRPLYVGAGYHYVSESLDDGNSPEKLITLFFGSDLNLGPLLAFQLDLGLGLLLDYTDDPCNDFCILEFTAPRVGPIVNFRLQYRLARYNRRSRKVTN